MELACPLPAELYALVEQTPATVLLEGSWSRLFTAPLRVLEAHRAD
jgi:hypothetical protein